MDMAKNGRDCASLTPGQLGTPSSGIELLEDDLIHSLVYDVTLDQHLAKVAGLICL
jgi:hypothetical protein